MEHEASVSRLPEHSPCEACAFSVDGEGKVIHDEGAANEAFRRSPGEFRGMSLRNLLDPESPASRSAWARLGNGEGFDGELRLLRGDGTVFLAEVSISGQSDGGFAVRVEERGGRERDERVSRWAERHYGDAILRSVDFHLVQSLDGKIVRVSPEAGEHLGRNPEEMAGEPFDDHIHPDDLAWAGPTLEEVRRTPVSTARIEARLWHADGTWRHFEAVVSNLVVDPTVGGLVWHFRDVSEKVRIRDDLRRSGAQFQALVEGAQDMITLCSDANTILYASPSYKRILGFEPHEMVGLYVPSVIHPDDLQTAFEWAAKVSSDPDVTDAPPIRYRHKDGSWVYLESVFTNLMNDPEIRAVAIHSRDVTDRVETERKLAGSEARFRAIIENGQDVVAICDPDNTLRYVSASVTKTMGYEPEELVGSYVPDLIHPDDREEEAAEVSKIEGRHYHEPPVIRYRRKDGSYAWLECVTTNFTDDEAIGGIVVHARDVGERVRIEKALRESEERFRALVENAHDFVVLADERNVALYSSPSIEQILGYTPDEFVGTVIAGYGHPDEAEAGSRRIAEVLPIPGPHNMGTWRYRHKDGSYRWLEVVVNNKLDDPILKGVVCNLRDVTERVRMEEALKDSEARFRALVENTTDFITVAGADNVIHYISPAVEKVLGRKPEDLVGTKVYEVLHPDDLEAAARVVAAISSMPGHTPQIRFRLRHADGSYRILETVYNNLLDDPEIRGVVCTSRDVTDRVGMEEKLRESEERYRTLVEQVPAVNYTLAPAPEGEPGTMTSGSLSYISPRVEHLLGHPPERFLEDPDFWNSLIHPEDLEMVLAEDVRTDETGEPFGMEYRMRHRDGHYLWVKDDAALVLDEEGRPLLWQCVLSDITRRREAEEEVRRLNEGLERRVEERTAQLKGALEESEDSEELMRLSENRFRSLVQRSSDITTVLDGDGAMVYVSPAIEGILGYRVGELIEEKVRLHAHPDDKALLLETFEKVRSEPGRAVAAEFRFQHKDGSWRHLDAVFSDLSSEPGVAGVVVNARDITERKEAEDELKQSLNVLLALYETGQILTSTLDLETRGERLLEVMAGLFGLRAATIDLVEPDGELRTWKTRGPREEWEQPRKDAARTKAREKALASGKPEAFRQAEYPGLSPEGVCLPLRVGRRVVGMVEAFGNEGLGRKENLDVFVSLGNQSGSALENARLYSDLAEREKRLEELVGKLITAQEEERKRVAYEIHDGLAQTALAANQRLQMFIEDHPPGAVVGEGTLDRAMELVRQTGREARRVIANFRPTVLDDFGLASALRLHAETLRRDGLSVEYRESLGETRLSAHVETALYRVAQEALNNVRKHAPEANVRLSLHLGADGNVRLEVADDGPGFGPGFDPGFIQNGGPGERVGLSSMRERVALLGGEFEVESRPGSGASVRVEVHLKDGGIDG